jgi:hypothetical protein
LIHEDLKEVDKEEGEDGLTTSRSFLTRQNDKTLLALVWRNAMIRIAEVGGWGLRCGSIMSLVSS